MAVPHSPQQFRAKRTRRDLLTAARRVLALQGYERASVDEIVRAAGYSKGAFYFHFASKDDVLLALVDEWALEWSAVLVRAADAQQPPDVALAHVFDTLASPGNGWEGRLLLEFWAQAERNAAVGHKLAQSGRAWQRLLTEAFRRAQEAGAFPSDAPPEAVASAALALHDGLVVQSCVPPSARPSRQDDGAVAEVLSQAGTALARTG